MFAVWRFQEGPGHDRGLIFRCFEEVVGLSNATLALASKYTFGVTVLEIHNEQVGAGRHENDSTPPQRYVDWLMCD